MGGILSCHGLICQKYASLNLLFMVLGLSFPLLLPKFKLGSVLATIFLTGTLVDENTLFHRYIIKLEIMDTMCPFVIQYLK